MLGGIYNEYNIMSNEGVCYIKYKYSYVVKKET